MTTECMLALMVLAGAMSAVSARTGTQNAAAFPSGAFVPKSTTVPLSLFEHAASGREQRQPSRKRRTSSPCASPARKHPCRATMSAVALDNAAAGRKGSVETRTWPWKGYNIRYQVAGEGQDGPPMVLIHGFGGNADHWRKNLPNLAKAGPVFAIDLLGYGFSSKPDPGPWEQRNTVYCFETWSQQIRDFAKEVVGAPVFLVCNSVGGVAGLQAGVDAPDQVLGVVLFNITLRMLHKQKQAPLARPFVKGLQYVLRETPVGSLFFGSVAKAQAVSNILKQCYGDPEQVTEELVNYILTPGLEPGAVKVFLDFISYSGGPLPEELLANVDVPVVIGWGDQDPWEPIELGRAFAQYDSVEDFIVLPGAGHCPQDEAPHLTDPIVLNFVAKHYRGQTYET